MKLFFFALLSAALCSQLPLSLPPALLCSKEVAKKEPLAALPQEQIRVVAVKPTPEPDTAILALQVPKMGQVVGGNPVWIQTRIDGYTMGSDSQFDRAYEILNSKLGQTMHVIIDDKPYFAVNGPAIDPFNEQGWYYDQNYKFEVPFKLQNGFHTIRILLARSYGESLKSENMFFASYFFVGEEDDDSQAAILTKPYLTYNEPSNTACLEENKPILLDFYLSNVELSPDGYKVKLTVDHKIERTLASWQPYYIYGLKKGKHTLRLQLIDKSGKQVEGLFNDVEQTFTVH